MRWAPYSSLRERSTRTAVPRLSRYSTSADRYTSPSNEVVRTMTSPWPAGRAAWTVGPSVCTADEMFRCGCPARAALTELTLPSTTKAASGTAKSQRVVLVVLARFMTSVHVAQATTTIASIARNQVHLRRYAYAGPVTRLTANTPNANVSISVATSRLASDSRHRQNATAATPNGISNAGSGAEYSRSGCPLKGSSSTLPVNHCGTSPNWPPTTRYPSAMECLSPSAFVKSSTTSVRFPGDCVNCWMPAGNHMTTSTAAATKAALTRSRDRVSWSSSASPRRRRVRISQVAPQTRSGMAIGAYPTCVWTQNDATPTSTGRAQASPQVIAHVRSTRSPNGSTVMYGFHGSRRNDAPRDRISTAQPTSVSSTSGSPPRRRTTMAIPEMARPLINRAPSPRPIEWLPVSR